MTIKKGTIAKCDYNTLGLITCDEPQEVTYDDGTKAMAWVGVHLTDKTAPIGSPWSSRNPMYIGEIDDVLPVIPSSEKEEKVYKLLSVLESKKMSAEIFESSRIGSFAKILNVPVDDLKNMFVKKCHEAAAEIYLEEVDEDILDVIIDFYSTEKGKEWHRTSNKIFMKIQDRVEQKMESMLKNYDKGLN